MLSAPILMPLTVILLAGLVGVYTPLQSAKWQDSITAFQDAYRHEASAVVEQTSLGAQPCCSLSGCACKVSALK